MPLLKCPDCGARRFYVKDPEDQYNIFEFDLTKEGVIQFDEESGSNPIEVLEETETYCDRCAWHGKFGTLK